MLSASAGVTPAPVSFRVWLVRVICRLGARASGAGGVLGEGLGLGFSGARAADIRLCSNSRACRAYSETKEAAYPLGRTRFSLHDGSNKTRHAIETGYQPHLSLCAGARRSLYPPASGTVPAPHVQRLQQGIAAHRREPQRWG